MLPLWREPPHTSSSIASAFLRLVFLAYPQVKQVQTGVGYDEPMNECPLSILHPIKLVAALPSTVIVIVNILGVVGVSRRPWFSLSKKIADLRMGLMIGSDVHLSKAIVLP